MAATPMRMGALKRSTPKKALILLMAHTAFSSSSRIAVMRDANAVSQA